MNLARRLSVLNRGSLIFAMLLLFALSANASLVVSVSSTAAGAGSTGNVLEVTLANTGPSSVTIAGFSFELVSSSGDIVFTQANTSTTTAPYIFNGASLFGPVISTATGQTLDASDLSALTGTTLGSGTTLGLGHVLFDVSGTAVSQAIAVTITGSQTTLTDPSGGNVPIDSLLNGSIRVTGSGSSVPEPGSIMLLGSGLAGLAGVTRRRSRR